MVDDGHRRFIKILHDVIHGISEAAGSVQLDDERFIVLFGGHINGARYVICRGRADGAINFNQTYLRRRRRRAQKQPRNQDETPMLHDFST